jgi:hypothetical protein
VRGYIVPPHLREIFNLTDHEDEKNSKDSLMCEWFIRKVRGYIVPPHLREIFNLTDHEDEKNSKNSST